MANRIAAWLTALAFFVADQFSKWLVSGPFGLKAEGDQLQLLPIFDLTRVHNHGVSLGFAQAQNDTHRWLQVAATGAIAAHGGLVDHTRRQARRPTCACIGARRSAWKYRRSGASGAMC